MLGINGPEFLVLGLLALLVIGPERLPHYAAQLGRVVREVRRMASGARDQVRQELGPEFDDIDWQKLDPRQYDPRRIVREALSDLDESDSPSRSAASGVQTETAGGGGGRPASRSRAAGAATRPRAGRAGTPAPFDNEAT